MFFSPALFYIRGAIHISRKRETHVFYPYMRKGEKTVHLLLYSYRYHKFQRCIPPVHKLFLKKNYVQVECMQTCMYSCY